MRDRERAEVAAYYDRGGEFDRLTGEPIGALEFERTKEILRSRLPPPPALVADIGGGPGRYSWWLADLGYAVEHRDLRPLHVRQARAGLTDGMRVRSQVADALDLDLAGSSVDAVLLFGPLYHLKQRADRLAALREAGRIVRPGGLVFVAAISRWAPRLDAELRARAYDQLPAIRQDVARIERDGRGKPLYPGAFTAYYHRPAQLRQEVRASGLLVADLVSVEGAAFLLSDLAERLADPGDREVVLDAARATQRVPELLGVGPHLLVTATRPA